MNGFVSIPAPERTLSKWYVTMTTVMIGNGGDCGGDDDRGGDGGGKVKEVLLTVMRRSFWCGRSRHVEHHFASDPHWLCDVESC